MSRFKFFQDYINDSGVDPVWSDKNNIHFAQTRDCYLAGYRPNFPGRSPEDSDIIYQHISKDVILIGPHADIPELRRKLECLKV